ncbi:exodeoxyribonuclease VII small subunit [Staphylococcus durrellii]|uniref:exodeoxyribonuclease VII small subunit n=1 Tax=Staphylococcus durrellii TaxID=2781773 RepID=UPI00189D5238|nr:exodeoxyribonuclease VII small subunit [Staphylococcus durrellii]MBF7017040.1 exodeoxyribonuclease VII small subunit [Staphylococcus durrellii]
MTNKKQSFEEMMEELESIVQKLDNENVSLEESLDLYQRGMKLSASCEETLKNAETKVNELIKEEEKEDTKKDQTNEKVDE